MFDYSSYAGIEQGADDLTRRLRRFTGRLTDGRFALVAHSMGGLVAKRFARTTTPELKSGLAGIATLGTPHGGIRGRNLNGRKRLIAMLLDFLERDEPPDPYRRSWRSPALRQLLGIDEQQIITTLLDADRTAPLQMPLLTVSGGLGYIELFEPGTRWNAIANRLIQANLVKPNDGLVEDRSADLGTLCNNSSTKCRHERVYGGWARTNHTHMLSNQDVGEILVDWLGKDVFVAR